jgi:hypothetical protein
MQGVNHRLLTLSLTYFLGWPDGIDSRAPRAGFAAHGYWIMRSSHAMTVARVEGH